MSPDRTLLAGSLHGRPSSDALPGGTAITLGCEAVPELTTEHDTQIVVRPRRGRLAWMRLPASHAHGVVNADPRDGRWQRPDAIWPEGPIVDNGPPIGTWSAHLPVA